MTDEGRDSRGRYARQVGTVDRDSRALTLRIDGATYSVIATALGYSDKGAAYKAVQRGLAETLTEPADELRKLELERLDALHLAAWRVMTARHLVVSGGKVVEHDGEALRDDMPTLRAIDTLLRVSERRARLLGLDAPVKAEVGGVVRYEIVGVDPEDL